MSEDALTDLPEIDSADMTAVGFEASPDPVDDEPAGDEPQEPAVDDEPAADPEAPADPNAGLPEYRREAIAKRERQEFLDRIERLEQALEAKKEPPPAAIVQPGEELTPEQQKVQGKFFKLFPAAKRIFERADDIIRAAEVAPNLATQAEEADNHRATSALATVTDSVATRILGAGKTGADLRPEARKRIVSAFATWAGADYAQDPSKMPKEVQARAVRYQNGDAKLFDEFAADYVQDFTPVNRTERVTAAARATAKSPRGGPSSAPPPAGPKQPDPGDEDELHNAAFRSVRAAAAAQ